MNRLLMSGLSLRMNVKNVWYAISSPGQCPARISNAYPVTLSVSQNARTLSGCYCLRFCFCRKTAVVMPGTGSNLALVCLRYTMVDNGQEYSLKYWATRSFARTDHSFACSGLLASLAPSAALTRVLARSLRSLPHSWGSD